MPYEYSDDQKQKLQDDAKAKGVSQDYIDNFLKQNPNDYNRIESSYNSQKTGQGEDSMQTGGAWDPNPDFGKTPPSAQGQSSPWSSGSGGGSNPTSGMDAWLAPALGSLGSSMGSMGSSISGGLSALGSSLGGAMGDQTKLWQQMFDAQQAKTAQDASRNTDLYNTLQGRANQSLNIDPNDPIIANQVNSYNADEQRAARQMINAQAESQGPGANLDAERRMAMEKVGQDTGSLRAQLMGNELTSRRNEIASALQSMGGQLTADQSNALQSQLGMLDNAIAQQGVGNTSRGLDIQSMLGLGGLANQSQLGNRGLDVQSMLGQGGLQNNLLGILLGNQLGNAQLTSSNDQFAQQFGLNSTNQANYWDWLRSTGHVPN